MKKIKPRNWIAVSAHFRRGHIQRNKKSLLERNMKYRRIDYD
jgi:hypothetical protein